ncbi:MAG: DJ-1/PfpI family protein [Candidatus Aenigmatarchaeota archaeon]|nr:DJ-1/PfpI family protein [Candidatus Aenigmarchaeota archaeon]
MPLEGKRVLIVIAPYDFNDRQLAIISSTLSKAGLQLTVVNSTGQAAKGEQGNIVTPHSSFYHVESRDFDAIIFIGGAGSSVYRHNRRALQLVHEFFAAGKPVAAIELAPPILAAAHILRGRRATARPTERDDINAFGLYTGAPVEVDGNIITAQSTAHAAEFAVAILNALRH